EQKRQGAIGADQLQALQTEDARQRIQDALDERGPLGTNRIVKWGRYQCVKVQARVVVHPEEDAVALKKRVLDRLYDLINPIPTKVYGGWRFGQSLRTSHLYDAVLAEPGVSYVDNVKYILDDVPETDVQCVAFDNFQPNTWYSGSHGSVYRTMD